MGHLGKPCDSCRSASAALFCRADTAFLCLGCDARIHCANRVASRHERVWVCEVCEQAPAAVTCKADAAALCVTCDADIHSANPLARRHDRVPVEPFFDPADSLILHHNNNNNNTALWTIPEPEPEAEPESKPIAAKVITSDMLFFSEMDTFLDFDYPSADSVVPVKVKQAQPIVMNNNNSHLNFNNNGVGVNHNNNNNENCFHIDFCRSKLSSSFAYPPPCLSHSVSSSSLDVGVVPDGNNSNNNNNSVSMSEISYSFGRNSSHVNSDPIPSVPVSSTTTSSAQPQPTQLCGLDREARVLRYREKRKNRKFEKTIRYASRKAYAETRPRIKGRFAKRTDADLENDSDFIDHQHHIYGSSYLTESQYGVVPSF